MNKDTGALGPLIKAARKDAGLSRREFSQIVGLADRYIAGVENEGVTPGYKSLFKFITALGVDANSIFYPDKPTKGDRLSRMCRQLKLCDENELSIIDAVLGTIIRIKTMHR